MGSWDPVGEEFAAQPPRKPTVLHEDERDPKVSGCPLSGVVTQERRTVHDREEFATRHMSVFANVLLREISPPKVGPKLVRRRYAEPMIDAVALVPMKTLPGWPEAEFSSVHLLMLCVVWPIATAVLFTLIGWGVHFAKGRGGKNSD